MRSFQLQWMHETQSPDNRVGVLLFDREQQTLRHFFLNKIKDQAAINLLQYLDREFTQMQEKMNGGIVFTPFDSLSQISSQLLPGNSAALSFSQQQQIEAGSIEQALADAKLFVIA